MFAKTDMHTVDSKAAKMQMVVEDSIQMSHDSV